MDDNVCTFDSCATWLMTNELNLPSILNDDVEAFSVSAMNIWEKLHVGRTFGGISVIWKKKINKFVSIRTYYRRK